MRKGMRTAIALLFIAVYAMFSFLWVMTGMDSISATIWTDATMTILIAVCLFANVPWCQMSLTPKKISRSQLLYILALMFVVWLATQSVSLWFIDNGFYIPHDNGESTNIFMYIFLSVVAAPFVEELLMRGILFTNISCDFNVIVGSVVSSLIFAVLHGTIIHLITAFICGMMFAYVYIATRSLLYSIFVHATYNALSIVTTGMAVPSLFGSLGVAITLLSLSIIGIIVGMVICMRSEPRIDLRAKKSIN